MSRLSVSDKISTLPDRSKSRHLMRLPLPGVIILVHGVNSEGEWYEAAEEGLCAGLNTRLARHQDQLVHTGPEAGELVPARYTGELTSSGHIDPERDDKNFIEAKTFWSPVIRFRWGYKASKEDLQAYGADVWLNEQDYWGGGPFANGCSSLPDLWAEGLNDRLFLWITAQHVNPVKERDVYGCPPRAYCVHAGLRLAKLIGGIRKTQPDCPISVVCHSQGNMVGLAGAFIGDKLGIAPADSYVLCNPPYSLLENNGSENWVLRGTDAPDGTVGRQTGKARVQTLSSFFQMVRKRIDFEQDADAVDRVMANKNPLMGLQFKAQPDRDRHGLNRSNYGRVTLYCNPHDQVISATTVQGMGWLGLTQDQINDCSGNGCFTQRVFAQGFTVGVGGTYSYWADRWNANAGHGKDGFWNPASKMASFSLLQGIDSNTNVLAKIGTLLLAPVLYLVVAAARTAVNAEPDKTWTIPVVAPPLREPFAPTYRRYGVNSADFDQGYDPDGNARSPGSPENDDPYAKHPTGTTKDGKTDDAQGNKASDAQLRYEHHARLRMQARRAGMAGEDGKVIGEDEPDKAEPEYKEWREEKIATFLKDSIDQAATDHSTIVTQPMHSEKALAYDVVIGECKLLPGHWTELRVEADWRLAKGMEQRGLKCAAEGEYFRTGKMKGSPMHKWVNEDPEVTMSEKIVDQRSWTRRPTRDAS